MKIINLTPEVIAQLNACIDMTIEFINDYKSDNDREKLVKRLCLMITAKPNVSYLDPDILDMYGIEIEECQWVEANADELKVDIEALTDIVKHDSYEPHRLSIGSSASILVSIFGDAYYQVRRFK